MPSPTHNQVATTTIFSQLESSEFCPLDIMNIFQWEFQECTFEILQLENISHLRNTYSEVNHRKVHNQTNDKNLQF
jgi:hypothetical protein